MADKNDSNAVGVMRRLRYAAAVLGVLAGAVSAQEWKPERNVEIVVSSGAGGAADRSARVIQIYCQRKKHRSHPKWHKPAR